MDKYFHSTLYWVCNYLSILGLKLIHISKRATDATDIVRSEYQYALDMLHQQRCAEVVHILKTTAYDMLSLKLIVA